MTKIRVALAFFPTTAPAPEEGALRAGLHESPPFTMKSENLVLLEITEGPEWDALIQSYPGE